MNRRALLIQQALQNKGFFKEYRTYLKNIASTVVISWDQQEENQLIFKRKNHAFTSLGYVFESSIVNPDKDAYKLYGFTDYSAIGYDSTKRNKISFTVLNKNITTTSSNLTGTGTLKFTFKGPTLEKQSEEISIKNVEEGTVFTIIVEPEEILNNLCLSYTTDAEEGYFEDFYPCNIYFEVNVQEI